MAIVTMATLIMATLTTMACLLDVGSLLRVKVHELLDQIDRLGYIWLQAGTRTLAAWEHTARVLALLSGSEGSPGQAVSLWASGATAGRRMGGLAAASPSALVLAVRGRLVRRALHHALYLSWPYLLWLYLVGRVLHHAFEVHLWSLGERTQHGRRELRLDCGDVRGVGRASHLVRVRAR